MHTDTLTMFGAVAAMNVAFGNPKGDPENLNLEKLKKQCQNIRDEYGELMLAIEAGDPVAIRDALCDINVFSLGAHHLAGYDADADMGAVYRSNMSKFIRDDVELEATIAKYDDLGVPFYQEGEFPTMCLKASADFTDRHGNEYRKGKFLKGIAYKTPVFQ